MYIGLVYSLKWGEFVQNLHLIGYYNVLNLETRAIGWFLYLCVA